MNLNPGENLSLNDKIIDDWGKQQTNHADQRLVPSSLDLLV